jgi:hypothetical protein
MEQVDDLVVHDKGGESMDDDIGFLTHEVDRLIGRHQIDAAAIGHQAVGREVITFAQVIAERVQRPSDLLQGSIVTQLDAGSQSHHVPERVQDGADGGDLGNQHGSTTSTSVTPVGELAKRGA